MSSDTDRPAFPRRSPTGAVGRGRPGGGHRRSRGHTGPDAGASQPAPVPGGPLTRRSFVVRAIAGIGALIAVIVGVPVAAFAAMPFFRSKTAVRILSDSVAPTLRSTEWANAGPIDDYKVGVPKLAPLQRTVSDGWNSGTETVVVYVVRETEVDVTAFDIHCTHLGCPLSYSSGAQRFVCPCHGGTFDIEGGRHGRSATTTDDALRDPGRGRQPDGRPAPRGQLRCTASGRGSTSASVSMPWDVPSSTARSPATSAGGTRSAARRWCSSWSQVVTGIVLTHVLRRRRRTRPTRASCTSTRHPFGGLLRGIHHWSAGLVVLLIGLHMLRVFVWGAYKYPREPGWVGRRLLFFVVLGFGFTGYLLPWDQKAYWATQVGTNIAGIGADRRWRWCSELLRRRSAARRGDVDALLRASTCWCCRRSLGCASCSPPVRS